MQKAAGSPAAFCVYETLIPTPFTLRISLSFTLTLIPLQDS